MKFNIEIDCTPQEARQLFGLPDLEPLHDVYLDRVKELMANCLLYTSPSPRD